MHTKRILMSLAAIVFLGGAVAGGTGAFFSDEETSTGNTFTAGAIDLTVDSEAHYNGMVCKDQNEDPAIDDYRWEAEAEYTPGPNQYPVAGTPCTGSWELRDLGNGQTGPSSAFFSYGDLKPGDNGENTISLHVENNDAWACAIIDNMVDYENGCTEPEGVPEGADVTCAGSVSTPKSGAGAGELSDELRFFAWAETDGNNVWDTGEPKLFSNTEGPASDILDGQSYPLFVPGLNNSAVLTAGQTKYIGLYWCYGAITATENTNTLACNGQPVTNKTQTDALEADITFYVEQARNNPNFTCPQVGVQTKTVTLENETPQDFPTPWIVLDGDQVFGTLSYKSTGPTFDYTFTGQGLLPGTAYSLIYYADPYPGNFPGAFIGSGTTDASGNISFSGSPNLGIDLPTAPDTNAGAPHFGAKVWLVPSANYNEPAKSVIWPGNNDTSSWLFEGNVYVNYDDTDI